MIQQRILVVDDEEDICEILQFNLELEGYLVDVAHSAEEALTLNLSKYNLLLLDVMMGDISGFNMAKIIKNNLEFNSLSIIFITAKDNENDLITGFNIGADDYISKPFSIKEVILRVKAVLRRHNPVAGTVVFEGITIFLDSKTVTIDDSEVYLSKIEFELLLLFLTNQNKVLSRNEILKRVWKGEVCVLDRTVDVNIARVRKKIGRYASHLVSRQGYGYSFNS